MKKTLKILMAIILFAVVLTIATSVNAATTAKVSELATDGSVDGVTLTGKVPTIDGDAFTAVDELIVDTDLYISGAYDKKITVNSGATLTITDNEVKEYAEIVNAGKVVVEDKATITKLTNSGVAELQAKPGTLVMKSGSIIKSAATFTYANTDFVNDAVAKEYSKLVWKDGTNFFVVPTAKINFEAYAEDRAGDKVTVPVANEANSIKVKATYNYDNKDVEFTNASTLALVEADEDSTDLSVAGTNLTVQTARVGTEVKVKVEFTDMDVEKEFVIFEKQNNDENNQPEDPTKPEDPTNPDQPANPDAPKGDLDDAASVATGDHIIPATALLAVVVVANVVYFAKMKNN